MDSIIVTFQDGDRRLDLQVPVYVKVGELLEMLEVAYCIPGGREHRIQAEPLGRILGNDKTLEEEAVTSGSLLTLI